MLDHAGLNPLPLDNLFTTSLGLPYNILYDLQIPIRSFSIRVALLQLQFHVMARLVT